METIAFRMKLKPGHAAEYQRRHDAIWPELADLLRRSGISSYRIFLDEPDGTLFACLNRAEGHGMDALPAHPLMRRWWGFMADIMETNADGSPVVVPLREVFHLP